MGTGPPPLRAHMTGLAYPSSAVQGGSRCPHKPSAIWMNWDGVAAGPPHDRTVHEASRGRARTHAFRGNVQGPNSPGLRSQLSASQEGRGRKKFPELRKQSVLELRRAYPSVCTGLPARYRPRCGGLGRQLSPEPPGVSGCRPLGARPARGAPQAPSASSPQLRGLAPWPADSSQGESSR